MNKRAGITAIVVAVIVAAAVAIFFSPHLTMRAIGKAVDSKDTIALSEHIDFPALREDLKGKLLLKMSQEMKKTAESGNQFAQLGQMFAIGLVNQLVDAFVSPAGVMLMLEQGKPLTPKPRSAADSSERGPTKMNYNVQYQGWSKVLVRAPGEEGGFVFRRDGLWSWKLVALDLPTEMQ